MNADEYNEQLMNEACGLNADGSEIELEPTYITTRYGSVALEGVIEWDMTGNATGLTWLHPLTGSPCDSPAKCMAGWSEQDSGRQAEWDSLLAAIVSDDDLIDDAAGDNDTFDRDYTPAT